MRSIGNSTKKLCGNHFHSADDTSFRHMLAQVVTVFEQQFMHLSWCRLIRGEPVHCLPRLPENIWVRDGTASDMDCVAIRLRKTAQSIFRSEDIAATGDRNRNMTFDFPHQVPVSPALIGLDTRPAVERHHRSTAVLDQLRYLDTID